MNKYEAKELSKEMIDTALLRCHVQAAVDDAPPTNAPEFLPWFETWQRDAVRLLGRKHWWNPRHVMEWAALAIQRHREGKAE